MQEARELRRQNHINEDDRQQQRLQQNLPAELAARVDWIDRPFEEDWEGVVFANEVIDALPTPRNTQSFGYLAQGVRLSKPDVGGQQQIYALKTVCTHLGCTPNWLEAEQKFKCPCHGSGFYKDGVNFEGPAPRPLERLKIALSDDGQILIDRKIKFLYEKGEWSKPDCFLKYS